MNIEVDSPPVGEALRNTPRYLRQRITTLEAQLAEREREVGRLTSERDEARTIVDEDEGCWIRSRCPSCGHRMRPDLTSDNCPQCGVFFKAPWHYNEDVDYPEDCECERCQDARQALTTLAAEDET